jgi:anthranilate synthase component 2
VEPLVDEVIVLRNDAFELEDIEAFDGIILSPGPGLPEEAGLMPALIERYHKSKAILGVCLGHQAIGEFFGATLENLPQVLHGQPSECELIEEDSLFKECGRQFTIGHYHSWVISEKGFPSDELIITARDKDGHIMAIRHKALAIHGVQFHPESILTPKGKLMIHNWVAGLGINFVKN